MQTASFRNWTWVAKFTSYNNKPFIMSASTMYQNVGVKKYKPEILIIYKINQI